MIDQAVFEEICKTEIADLEQNILSGKTKTKQITKTGLKIFLMPKKGNLDIGIIPGVSFTGYLFINQLEGIEVKINDRFKVGSVYYEVISDGQFRDQNLDYETFYELDLEKRFVNQ